MLNTAINDTMAVRLGDWGLSPLPDAIIDRNGRPMDISRDAWLFNVAHRHVYFQWSGWGLSNPILAYALKRYVLNVIQKNSPQDAYNTVQEIKDCLTHVPLKWAAIQTIDDVDALAVHLFALLGGVIEQLRRRKKMYRFSRIRAWYNWCVEILPEMGFTEEHALELSQVYVPGNVKGEAVSTEDEEGGPLWDVEVRALAQALKDDASMQRQHVLQRAAVALSLAYGRNPANYVLLREGDFEDLMGGAAPPEWGLNIPRIKKRGQGDRQDFILESVDKTLAPYIQALIDANRAIDTAGLPRALFMRTEADPSRLGTPLEEYAFHVTTDTFKWLIHGFVDRVNVISPRTGQRLKLSPRRLRYTFATSMVEQGVSRIALARMLDHSDTQNVEVYFELKGQRLLKHLDKAAARRIGPVIGAFKGHIISSDAEAINGDNPARRIRFARESNPAEQILIGVCGQSPLCRLDPPFSCYLCNKFQPYRDADHEGVLEELVKSRDTRMEKYGERIGIQVDDVIYAVAEVVQLIHPEQPGDSHGAA